MIELIEKYPCDSRKELETRERHFIESKKCVNKNIAGRTGKQYYKDNQNKLLENRKQYYEVNRDVINAKQSIKHTCECGGNYTHRHRSTHIKTIKHQTFVKQPESD